MSYINIGDKFGKLTVLECVSGDKAETREWRCKCDCGNTVVAKEKYLKNGHRKSCGCLYGSLVFLLCYGFIAFRLIVYICE